MPCLLFVQHFKFFIMNYHIARQSNTFSCSSYVIIIITYYNYYYCAYVKLSLCLQVQIIVKLRITIIWAISYHVTIIIIIIITIIVMYHYYYFNYYLLKMDQA